MPPVLALKVDVDTERGTREGVPALAALLEEFSAPACFLFSLGPDNTGKAIRRVFRPGFFRKVTRTSVVRTYGLRTLLNGTLLPAPHIGRRHAGLMRGIRDRGFEVGIHSYDHFHWQDHVLTMPLARIRTEFGRAREEFHRIFGGDARTAGAAGWQANDASRQIYDEAGLLYASDTRGGPAFFPMLAGSASGTLEIPTTLPTFDELMGRPEYPDHAIVPHLLTLLREDRPNVFTLHAEIEGMAKLALFRDLLHACAERGICFVRMDGLARQLLENRSALPVRDLILAEIDGRSGQVATQASPR